MVIKHKVVGEETILLMFSLFKAKIVYSKCYMTKSLWKVFNHKIEYYDTQIQTKYHDKKNLRNTAAVDV